MVEILFSLFDCSSLEPLKNSLASQQFKQYHSLYGKAKVKIKGVQHEFQAVTGVKEDVLDIILALKQLRMKVYADEAVTLKLVKKGEGPVTAADIEKNADVEIANPDLVLATITSASMTLDMEITVSRGRGFLPTEEREDTSSDIGVMAIDALFSPVRQVSLKVENTRVGDITNYDKLIMNIETDGTLAPSEALEQATKILINHFTWMRENGNDFVFTDISLHHASKRVLRKADVGRIKLG